MSIELTTEPQTVHVRLGGISGLLAIKRRLDVPTHLITDVEAMDRRAIPPGEGTWLRAFRPKRVLVITIRDWDYARVVLGLADPEMHASAISAAIA
jgi:hypothetical protein